MPQSPKARRLRYARDPDFRLRSVNYKRIKAGKKPLERPEDIGQEFLAHLYSRRRDRRGRYV